jgi:1-acyl-sn-glycerol-3-phosphate acyltransferase
MFERSFAFAQDDKAFGYPMPDPQSDSAESSASSPLPRVSPFLLRHFQRHTRRFLAKNFHAVRLSRAGGRPAVPAGTPVVVYANHSSWWDPMLGVFLTRELFPARTLYAPIDAAALERYKFFAKLGFFGIDRERAARGAAEFLKRVRAILASEGAMLWLTPQGRFADARERPLAFEPGIAHLARRIPGVLFLPMALEYVFWEERTPEVLIRFGDALESEAGAARGDGRDTAALLDLLQRALLETQDALAAESIRRDPADFEVLLAGRAGVNVLYDAWRTAKAALRGESFRREHGEK